MTWSNFSFTFVNLNEIPKIKSGAKVTWHWRRHVDYAFAAGRLRLKYDGTRAENRFRLSAKRTNPFKSAGASVQSTNGSQSVRISGRNAGYTMFRRSVKSTGCPLESPVSPSLPLPCVTVCHQVSTGLYSKYGAGHALGPPERLGFRIFLDIPRTGGDKVVSPTHQSLLTPLPRDITGTRFQIRSWVDPRATVWPEAMRLFSWTSIRYQTASVV